ncbi:MAG: HPr family phosphocarrier protein [Eubacteriales bacterium]|nr:HPr family phosphocarrier protein [Eubacteriales bacterium]
MVTYKLVVQEPMGLHLRPAGKLCECSQRFTCRILLKKGTQTANVKSVLGLLAARVTQGDEIELICDGSDEEEALAALISCLQEEFETEKED